MQLTKYAGIAALIKVLLMLQHQVIPLQTNFRTLNPSIPALEPDKIVIPRNNADWNAHFKAACINNYGAAGSNATMIVTQAPSTRQRRLQDTLSQHNFGKFPVFISANTKESLVAYCKALLVTVSQLAGSMRVNDLLGSLAFNLSFKQNRALPHFISRTVGSIMDLKEGLERAEG